MEYYLIGTKTTVICKARSKNLADLGYPTQPVVATYDKYQWCLSHNVDILIDDKPDTAEKFADHPCTKVLQYIPNYGIWEPFNKEQSFTDPADIIPLIEKITGVNVKDQ